MIASLSLALAAAAAPAPALAPLVPGTPGHWSVATGETVSPDRDAISFEMGWPGLSFGYLHGVSDRSDFGIKIDLLYSLENTNTTAFGAGMDFPLRLVVNRHEKVSIQLGIEPGARVYTRSVSTPFGSTTLNDFITPFPVGGVLGIQATPELRLAASAALNMAIKWTNSTSMELGPQFGFAAEYAVDKNLLVGLNLHFGPQFYTYKGSPTDLAFTTEVVVGYRM